MARLTIEDCWWTDPRRSKLIKAIGDDDLADVIAMKAWRLAQEFWKHARGLVPKSLFSHLRNSEELIAAGLAEDRGEAVYVRGSSAYLDWLIDCQEAGRAGGRKSAQRPRDARGRLLPDHDPSSTQADAKRDPSESKLLSLSLTQNTKTNAAPRGGAECAFDLESAYRAYPLKKGKSRGLKSLTREIQTQQDYESLLAAIEKYKRTGEVKRGFIKHFSTFAGEWRDWLDADAGQVNGQSPPPLKTLADLEQEEQAHAP